MEQWNSFHTDTFVLIYFKNRNAKVCYPKLGIRVVLNTDWGSYACILCTKLMYDLTYKSFPTYDHLRTIYFTVLMLWIITKYKGSYGASIEHIHNIHVVLYHYFIYIIWRLKDLLNFHIFSKWGLYK